MHEVDVDGLRIAYERAGTGAPLILLHGGFGFDRRSWRRQIEELSDRYDVVAWDAPGCGRSADPPEGFGMAGYADCLAAFVDRLGLGRPHVLGLSFGAALALELYRRHPSVPRSLVLAGAYAGWAGSLPPDEVERRVARILAERDLPPERWIPDYLPGMLTEAAPPDMVAEVAALMSEVRTVANTAMLLAMAACDLRSSCPVLQCPLSCSMATSIEGHHCPSAKPSTPPSRVRSSWSFLASAISASRGPRRIQRPCPLRTSGCCPGPNETVGRNEHPVSARLRRAVMPLDRRGGFPGLPAPACPRSGLLGRLILAVGP